MKLSLNVIKNDNKAFILSFSSIFFSIIFSITIICIAILNKKIRLPINHHTLALKNIVPTIKKNYNNYISLTLPTY